ncbi:MAG: peptide ABC transporter substrate-binding protein [Cellvibrionales bacterium]|nr:peptide ABC transporter substrate-binding protein [Cellvibrionales bacterium]
MITLIKHFSLVVFLSSLLTACDTTQKETALNEKTQEITLALTAEPPKLNSLKSADSVSFIILDHLLEGLLRYDQHQQLEPAVAEKWQLTETGATFWLRTNAKWQDGIAVTAHDFVYAWQQVVNPKTASQYAFILYPIKNAEAINEGKLPPEALGVKAIDDFTLEVTFEKNCPYFLELVAFMTYRPARKDLHQQWGNAYAADAKTFIGNGPFTLTEWIHGAKLTLDKNLHYWDKDNISLNRINIPYVTKDPSALFNLFLEEKIATWIPPALGQGSIKKALKEHLPLHKFETGAVFYFEFNHRDERLTSNKHLRKAIQHVIDPYLYTNKVLGVPGNTPAHRLLPKWLMGNKKPLHEEYPLTPISIDEKVAREYLAQAKREMNLETIPPLYLLIDDGGNNGNKTGEFLQEALKDALGLTILLDKQIFKLRLQKQYQGEFDLILTGWAPDYNDPLTFADLFYSQNANNSGKYENPRYDMLIESTYKTTHRKLRAQLFAKMQQILQDDAVVIPLYFRGDIYVMHPRLTGIRRSKTGASINFNYASIIPKPTQPENTAEIEKLPESL